MKILVREVDLPLLWGQSLGDISCSVKIKSVQPPIDISRHLQ